MKENVHTFSIVHELSSNNPLVQQHAAIRDQYRMDSSKILDASKFKEQLTVISVPCESGRSIEQMMKVKLVQQPCGEVQEDAFFIGDLGEIHRQFKHWKHLLPRIEPYYAVKCNPDPMVLNTLASLGVGFDCASRAEISSVLELGVDASRLIYANPCKQASHVRYAQSQNVRMMTFDNMEELNKIKNNYPGAELVMRILTDDSRSICKLGTKFGAHLSTTLALFKYAKSLQLNVVGISFHVGSGCFDATAFHDAVAAAKQAFEQAASVGYELTLLDVGGGFPGSDAEGITFDQIASILGPAVDEMFPANIRVIAEPGRYFVSAAFSLAVNVTARRTVVDAENDEEKSYMLYVNDGVYGSFNCILFDHAVVTPRILMRDDKFCYGSDFDMQKQVKCSIWGPTCDSMDCISKSIMMPQLDVGDWLYFSNMGAYTMCAASTFNGFKKSSVLYTNTEACV